MFLNLHDIHSISINQCREENYLDNTSDFVSPNDFDGVEVILEQL